MIVNIIKGTDEEWIYACYSDVPNVIRKDKELYTIHNIDEDMMLYILDKYHTILIDSFTDKEIDEVVDFEDFERGYVVIDTNEKIAELYI